MKVICISGKAQHGKDTTANFMKEVLEADGYTVLLTHYGDLVKYICKTFFGWNGVKDEYGRDLLQHVGTDVIRSQNPDYWVGFIHSILEFFPDEWDYVIIPDCRFPNEIDFMRNTGEDTIHIRVDRPDFESPLTIEQQQHISETALDDSVANYWISNTGSVDDLKDSVTFIINDITGYEQMVIEDFFN